MNRLIKKITVKLMDNENSHFCNPAHTRQHRVSFRVVSGYLNSPFWSPPPPHKNIWLQLLKVQLYSSATCQVCLLSV